MTQPCRSEIGSPGTYHQSQSPVTHHFHTKPSRAGNTRPVGPPTSGPVGLLSGRRSARRSLSFTAASTSGLRQRLHVLHCEGRRSPAGVSVEKSGEAVGADLGGVEAARRGGAERDASPRPAVRHRDRRELRGRRKQMEVIWPI